MESIERHKGRIDWIDSAKGIGIILMLLGHVSAMPKYFIILIFSFHMPLFFFLSGYLYKSQNLTLGGVIVKISNSL